MAEVQASIHSGETAQRFVEFVMMQARQASFFLGESASPQTGRPEVHLEPAKLFIEQLAMIREKTRGNLSHQEEEILNNVLADLQDKYTAAKGR